MKYLSDYTQEHLTKAIEKHGAFFAFSKSQFDEKKVDLYISKFSPDEVIPYLYEKSMTDRIVCKIIRNCNLFDPNSIIKFIDVNLRRAVSLLDSDKLYYSNQIISVNCLIQLIV